MKATIVGFGSIGERHAQVLSEIGYQISAVSKRTDISQFPVFSSIEQAVNEWKPDYVVVANETAKHAVSLQELIAAKFSSRVMIEKPLAASRKELAGFSSLPFSATYIGYNLRFHPVLLKIKEWLSSGDQIITTNVHCGQYLPDWRPTQDYAKSYSADASRGGGVLRDLSHELDYAQWLAGPLEKLVANGGHRSDLAISSDDVFDIIGSSKLCPNVNIHVNYLHHVPVRRILISTTKDTITADVIAGRATSNLHGSFEFVTERNTTYLAMHQAVKSGSQVRELCSYDEGMQTLGVIEAAELSVKSKCWEDVR